MIRTYSRVSRHLCECGCGRITTLISMTDNKRGRIKGQPNRFIVGHDIGKPLTRHIRTKDTESPRRREYRSRHLELARIHDSVTYARKSANEAWMNNRAANAFQERMSLKIEVLSHYGPQGNLQCSWPDCTVDDVDCLTLDHIRNDGFIDRKVNKCGFGHTLYRKLRIKGYPAGFQTLCASHQLKKKLLFERRPICQKS